MRLGQAQQENKHENKEESMNVLQLLFLDEPVFK